MKKPVKILTAIIAAFVLAIAFVFAGCGGTHVTSIEKTSENGETDTFTVYYSDGTSYDFTVTNGKDGSNGKDGEDGKGVTAADLYAEYLKQTGENITYAEFLKKYLTFTEDVSSSVAQCLNSAMKVYTEFVETKIYGSVYRPSYVSETAIYTGSAVIWEIEESADGYAYLVTNYHVIYDSKADVELNGGMTAGRFIAIFTAARTLPCKRKRAERTVTATRFTKRTKMAA